MDHIGDEEITGGAGYAGEVGLAGPEEVGDAELLQGVATLRLPTQLEARQEELHFAVIPLLIPRCDSAAGQRLGCRRQCGVGRRQQQQQRETSPGIGEFDTAQMVECSVAQLAAPLHHRHRDRGIGVAEEGGVVRQFRIEGGLPRSLEVDGVDEGQAGVGGEGAGCEQFGNHVGRFLCHPVVDGEAGRFGSADVVERSQRATEGVLNGGEEVGLQLELLLGKESVGDIDNEIGRLQRRQVVVQPFVGCGDRSRRVVTERRGNLVGSGTARPLRRHRQRRGDTVG